MKIAQSEIKSDRFAPAYLALIVLSFCLILFLLDHETTSVWKLFEPGNLIALLFYFLPVWVFTFLIYLLLGKYRPGKSNLLPAVLIGIPLSIAGVILLFTLAMS